MDEFLKQIGIDTEAQQQIDGIYTVPIEDSNEYNKIYSRLERSDLVDEDAEESHMSADTSVIEYVGDSYVIDLFADFEKDAYRLEIKEV